MLVDAINHRTPEGATETTVLGPLYVQRAPEHRLDADISGTMEGAPLLVTGTAPGHQTLVTHAFAAGDPYLDSDVVFGVKDSLIRQFAGEPAGTAIDGREMPQP